METSSDIRSNSGTIVAPDAIPAVNRPGKLAPNAADLLAERESRRPVWLRAPKSGPEHYTGFSRAKLYELAGQRKIRSVSIRQPGQVKGTRLFHLQSVLDYIASCESTPGRPQLSGDKEAL